MKGWARGNLILISKTLYLVLQTISATPLLYEIGFIIRHTKLIRFISLAAAIGYLFMFFGFGVTSVAELEEPYEWKEHNMFFIFTELFLVYFFFFDSVGVPVSIAIILKETSMEFFQFFKRNAGARNDNVSLGFTDIIAIGRTIA